MPFTFTCPSCQARLKAPDESVGRVLACPYCKSPLVITRPADPPPTPAPAFSMEIPDDVPLQGDAYQDFEVVGDADEDGDEPYEDLEVEREGGEDVLEVLPATAEDLPSVLPAGEAGPYADSELLRPSRLFIKGRAGDAADLFVSATNSYSL